MIQMAQPATDFYSGGQRTSVYNDEDLGDNDSTFSSEVSFGLPALSEYAQALLSEKGASAAHRPTASAGTDNHINNINNTHTTLDTRYEGGNTSYQQNSSVLRSRFASPSQSNHLDQRLDAGYHASTSTHQVHFASSNDIINNESIRHESPSLTSRTNYLDHNTHNSPTYQSTTSTIPNRRISNNYTTPPNSDSSLSRTPKTNSTYPHNINILHTPASNVSTHNTNSHTRESLEKQTATSYSQNRSNHTGLVTPGITKSSNGNSRYSVSDSTSYRPSTVRVKKFGKNLGRPQRTQRETENRLVSENTKRYSFGNTGASPQSSIANTSFTLRGNDIKNFDNTTNFSRNTDRRSSGLGVQQDGIDGRFSVNLRHKPVNVDNESMNENENITGNSRNRAQVLLSQQTEKAFTYIGTDLPERTPPHPGVYSNESSLLFMDKSKQAKQDERDLKEKRYDFTPKPHSTLFASELVTSSVPSFTVTKSTTPTSKGESPFHGALKSSIGPMGSPIKTTISQYSERPLSTEVSIDGRRPVFDFKSKYGSLSDMTPALGINYQSQVKKPSDPYLYSKPSSDIRVYNASSLNPSSATKNKMYSSSIPLARPSQLQPPKHVLSSVSPNVFKSQLGSSQLTRSKIMQNSRDNDYNVKVMPLISDSAGLEHNERSMGDENAGLAPPPKMDKFNMFQKPEVMASNIASIESGKDNGEYRPNSSSSHISATNSHAPLPKKQKNMLLINGKSYLRLELLGRGGSSKVYKVQNNNGKIFAVKKVTFSDMDEAIIKGFKGEIDLLQRLSTEDRVVKLYDHEMKPTSVFLVMECGEIDLAHVLNARLSQPLDLSFVRYYATEMLHCLAAVHRHGIVHSDLKPANFLMVKGMLKIIDFGIANVVPEYTVNVHRDTHIGTPNYMAPEALLDANQFDPSAPEGVKCMKVGRPSDVWSCGCIIYQMIYGKPPYASYNGPQRMLAIMNPDVVVSYPATGLGGVRVPENAIDLMKGCLQRDPSKRLLVDQVIDSSFLNPRSVSKDYLKDLIVNAIRYGAERQGEADNLELDFLTNDVWNQISSRMGV